MPAIKGVDYLYRPDLKENQQGRLSKFQKSGLWKIIWRGLPGDIFLLWFVIMPLIVFIQSFRLDYGWEVLILMLLTVASVPLILIRPIWRSLVKNTDLLLDLIHEDIIFLEGMAIYNKSELSFDGMTLNNLIPHPFVFDGQFYRVYYLRRSKAFLTYKELAMKRKES